MSKRTRVAIYSGASALWAMAVLGAIGFARWLGLATRDTVLLVLAVAAVAVVGAFIPAVQLGLERWQEEQRGGGSEEHRESRRRE